MDSYLALFSRREAQLITGFFGLFSGLTVSMVFPAELVTKCCYLMNKPWGEISPQIKHIFSIARSQYILNRHETYKWKILS